MVSRAGYLLTCRDANRTKQNKNRTPATPTMSFFPRLCVTPYELQVLLRHPTSNKGRNKRSWPTDPWHTPGVTEKNQLTFVVSVTIYSTAAHALPPAYCRYVPRTAANGHAVMCDPGTYSSNIRPIQIKWGLKILNLYTRQWWLSVNSVNNSQTIRGLFLVSPTHPVYMTLNSTNVFRFNTALRITNRPYSKFGTGRTKILIQ